MKTVVAKDLSSGETLTAGLLNNPLLRARGYLFHRSPGAGEGMLFLYRRPRRVAVHMMGVPFPLRVIWIGASGKVASTSLLRPWTGFARSPVAVKAFLEISPEQPGFDAGNEVVWQ